jgi:N-acetylglucosaminyldiphosphoundecaprenol N-acetyl-beta-D-mannosaminyltransferase
MTMEAFDDPSFRRVMEGADVVVADGRPLVWALTAKGHSDVHHVRGQDLVLAVCRAAEERGLGVGLYGTTPESLATAERRLRECYPRLDVVFSYSPPFRALSSEEDRAITDDMRRSGAKVIFVATGCPKQEKWMAAHVNELDAVLIGAGAAIDMLGGLQPVAPRWMQASGLEWVFRLASDPARLWRRYAKHNSRFALLAGAEVVTARVSDLLGRVGRSRG